MLHEQMEGLFDWTYEYSQADSCGDLEELITASSRFISLANTLLALLLESDAEPDRQNVTH